METDRLSLSDLRNRLSQAGTDSATVLRETLYSEHYARFAAQLPAEAALELIEMLDSVSIFRSYSLTPLNMYPTDYAIKQHMGRPLSGVQAALRPDRSSSKVSYATREAGEIE
jgi:hypothetical protein